MFSGGPARQNAASIPEWIQAGLRDVPDEFPSRAEGLDAAGARNHTRAVICRRGRDGTGKARCWI